VPAAQPAPAPRPTTQPVPVIDIPEVEVEELGLAERLGLDAERRDDEVGPTS
jgi:cell division transport system ATP-binding protein